MNLSIFLDLKKAFDTVDDKTLMLKLQKYGIESASYNWFTSYLTNREQFCHWDGANSSRDILKCGVPQGSCLGPLLFLLYVNDFENCLEYMTPNIYADDTCVTIASENLNDQTTDVKNELENISNWMRINKLSLNASKSEFMVVGYRRKFNRVGNELSNLFLNNEVINRVEKIKYLVMNIDESLTWEEQYKIVKNKLKGGISSLRKLKDILPQEKLENCTKPSLKAIFAMVILFGMLFPTQNYPNCRDYK